MMDDTAQHSIVINKYEGKLPLITEIAELIEQNYSELFHSVIVHGSVATNEVIPYSDFDGLLVVKDKFVNSKQLKKFKSASMKLILKFDPLQHHGWFQILESQLDNYPEYYLPHEILEHSKLIFPNTNVLGLSIKYDIETIDYKRSLKQLIASIETQSNANFEKMKLYDFKSYLSKIMLLPSMYYSAKHNEGVFKKNSFDLVKSNFSDEGWSCIDIASDIRMHWNYKLSGFQRVIMTIPMRPFRKLTKAYISPKISNGSLDKIDRNFFKSLQLLINTINKDIFVA